MNFLALGSLFLVANGVFIGVTVALAVAVVGVAVAMFFVGSVVKKKSIEKRGVG